MLKLVQMGREYACMVILNPILDLLSIGYLKKDHFTDGPKLMHDGMGRSGAVVKLMIVIILYSAMFQNFMDDSASMLTYLDVRYMHTDSHMESSAYLDQPLQNMTYGPNLKINIG